MSRDKASAGRTPDLRRSMGMIRSTTAGDNSAPPLRSAVISSNNSATTAVSAAVPVMVISFPRTCISAPKEPSITWSSSSWDPSRLTMEWSSGTTTLTWVLPAAGSSAGVPFWARRRGSREVSVNSFSPPGAGPRPRIAEPMLSASTPRSAGSARRPGQVPAAQHMGMHVEHRLPRPGPGVEDDPVTVGRDPLGLGHPVGLGRHLGQQAGIRGGHRGQAGVVVPGDDQDVGGGLRADVAEGNDPVTFDHQVGRDVARHDLAEEAVSHGRILAAGPGFRARSALLIWPPRPPLELYR